MLRTAQTRNCSDDPVSPAQGPLRGVPLSSRESGVHPYGAPTERGQTVKPATAKIKGRATETMLVTWLRARGWRVERRRLTGSADEGDLVIDGAPDLVVEVKSAAAWQPVDWLRQADAEAIHAGATCAVVAARPLGLLDPSDWVGIVWWPDLVALLQIAEILPPPTVATLTAVADHPSRGPLP